VIKNKTQYRVTKEQVGKFSLALQELERTRTLFSAPLYTAQKDALASIWQELREQVAAYEARKGKA
jgi:hypothetical protein